MRTHSGVHEAADLAGEALRELLHGVVPAPRYFHHGRAPQHCTQAAAVADGHQAVLLPVHL